MSWMGMSCCWWWLAQGVVDEMWFFGVALTNAMRKGVTITFNYGALSSMMYQPGTLPSSRWMSCGSRVFYLAQIHF